MCPYVGNDGNHHWTGYMTGKERVKGTNFKVLKAFTLAGSHQRSSSKISLRTHTNQYFISDSGERKRRMLMKSADYIEVGGCGRIRALCRTNWVTPCTTSKNEAKEWNTIEPIVRWRTNNTHFCYWMGTYLLEKAEKGVVYISVMNVLVPPFAPFVLFLVSVKTAEVPEQVQQSKKAHGASSKSNFGLLLKCNCQPIICIGGIVLPCLE